MKSAEIRQQFLDFFDAGGHGGEDRLGGRIMG
jgi:alanyl-tRNA synthetase